MEATVQILLRFDFDMVIRELRKVGFCVIGPTEKNGVIVIDEISSDRDLPAGRTDEQKRGRYRLGRRDDGALFGYVNGPQSWKSYLYPPRVRIWRANRRSGRLTLEKPDAVPPRPLAFLGVRSCDLSAMMIQDFAFLAGSHIEPGYQARRASGFIIALNCTQPGENGFGDSRETCPAVKSLYDHPIWSEIAHRCLCCGNCTLVSPTCFCTTVENVTDLSVQEGDRRRTWDTGFTEEFSYIHGGNVRASAAARCRQWLTHKFAHGSDQFGMSGCVGCGRCITWRPAGIDLTEELAKLQVAAIALN